MDQADQGSDAAGFRRPDAQAPPDFTAMDWRRNAAHPELVAHDDQGDGTRQEPDRLVAVVERVIEDHLPGGSSGVDARSMAEAIVRRVRIEELAHWAAGRSETVAGLDRPAAAAPQDGGGA
jgi:hypothetical protein